jgi:hypothetical protein
LTVTACGSSGNDSNATAATAPPKAPNGQARGRRRTGGCRH